MSLDVLAMMAVVLTLTMFVTRMAMLGFPAAMMWAILGGYSYTQSVAVWDIYYVLAFASLLGMTTFCVLGAYGLREKRDTIADEEMELGEGEYVDERGNGQGSSKDKLGEEDDSGLIAPSTRTQRLRERARQRRQKTRKGEFDF